LCVVGWFGGKNKGGRFWVEDGDQHWTFPRTFEGTENPGNPAHEGKAFSSGRQRW